MKKMIFAGVTAFIISVFLAGCNINVPQNSENTLDIVCTAFPQYDWIKNITEGAENVNLILLCDNGTDMHSFQPSAKDILLINTSDIVVAVGGNSDKWVLDSAENNPASVKVSLLECLGDNVIEEMHFVDGHAHDENNADHDSLHEHDYTDADEHVWMSLPNAISLTEKICEVLCTKDAANSEAYKANTQSYVNKLNDLHNEYFECVDKAEKNAVVVADRFPFAYLMHAYGLEAFAAFPGCSSDTDATFDTIISLASKVDEHGISCVAVTESTDFKTADAVIENTKFKNAEIVVIDSMQSVTEKDVENGRTYISVMTDNLSALEKLLD